MGQQSQPLSRGDLDRRFHGNGSCGYGRYNQGHGGGSYEQNGGQYDGGGGGGVYDENKGRLTKGWHPVLQSPQCNGRDRKGGRDDGPVQFQLNEHDPNGYYGDEEYRKSEGDFWCFSSAGNPASNSSPTEAWQGQEQLITCLE